MSAGDHSRCKMAHVMRPDVIEAGIKTAARMKAQFVCRDCGKPFVRNHITKGTSDE
jgi:transposase-like protein